MPFLSQSQDHTSGYATGTFRACKYASRSVLAKLPVARGIYLFLIPATFGSPSCAASASVTSSWHLSSENTDGLQLPLFVTHVIGSGLTFTLRSSANLVLALFTAVRGAHEQSKTSRKRPPPLTSLGFSCGWRMTSWGVQPKGAQIAPEDLAKTWQWT